MSGKYFEPQFGRNSTERDWKEELRSLALRKKLNYQPLMLRVFLTRSRLLVRNSSPHSTCLPATYRYLAVPRVLVSS